MKKLFPLFLLLLFTDACVDRLEFDAGEQGESILVVDGQITDQPGPYTVKLLRSSNVDDILNFAGPFAAQSVTISDDAGNSEALKNMGAGQWETLPDGIQGQVGRSYSLRIVASDGSIFTSEPEKLLPPSSIDSIFAEWVENKPLSGATEFGFRIFIDSDRTDDGEDAHFRWRFTGTFTSQTFPQLRRANGRNCTNPPGPPDPPPCSGVQNVGGILKTVGSCTCCDCWVSEFAMKPILSDNIFTDGSSRKLEVGFVLFNEWTFSGGAYMVKVEQMRMNLNSFKFWKIIRDQKEGLKSLFQPSFGKIPTNFSSENSNRSIVGVFSAMSVTNKILFLRPGDAPISVPAFDFKPIENCALWISCNNLFPNSSFSPPPEWE